MRKDDIKQRFKIKYYEELPSTHTFVKERYDKLENNTVVIANRQNAGIGTHGRTWYSGDGNNIAMSILYKPSCSIECLESCTILVAKKIKECIKRLYNIDLEIKYPNDLILNNKKISGILTEINTISNKINYLIVSIGFNVNEIKFDEQTCNIATSLKMEFQKDFDRQEIIYNFISCIDEAISNCIKNN